MQTQNRKHWLNSILVDNLCDKQEQLSIVVGIERINSNEKWRRSNLKNLIEILLDDVTCRIVKNLSNRKSLEQIIKVHIGNENCLLHSANWKYKCSSSSSISIKFHFEFLYSSYVVRLNFEFIFRFSGCVTMGLTGIFSILLFCFVLFWHEIWVWLVANERFNEISFCMLRISLCFSSHLPFALA